MSTIPISLTEKQFDQHIRVYISVSKRGYECKIALYKVFNYILYRLHTGCQWYQLPIDPDVDHPEKKKSAMMPFITIFASGVGMAAYKRSGKAAL